MPIQVQPTQRGAHLAQVSRLNCVGLGGLASRQVVAGSGPQAPAYFGGCQSDGSPLAGFTNDFYVAQYWYNDPSILSYTCPGVGTRTVTELSHYCKNRGATTSIRLGIYDIAGNLLYQGDSAATISSTSNSWVGHTSFLDSGGSPATPQLIGGTNYIIVVAMKDGGVSYTHITAGVVGNSTKGIAGDQTGGLPTTISIAPGNGNTLEMCTRCLVT